LAPATGQDRELVGHRPGLDVVQDTGSEPQIVRGPHLQDRVISGPGDRVLPADGGPPPRVRIREALTALIVPHAPSQQGDLTEWMVRRDAYLTKPRVIRYMYLTKARIGLGHIER
jgi:hypothetical protein